MDRKTLVLAALLLSVPLFVSGCGGEEIESRWRDREITVDGDASEWRGTEQYSDDEKGVRFAVFNDAENLYMCLTTWNATTQQQILVRGITFWFDPEGGEKRNYGIDYPMAKGPEEMKNMREMRDTASRDRAKAIEGLIVGSRSEMSVGRAEKSQGHWMFVEDANKMGIEAALAMDDRILVLELKVPLTGGDLLPFPRGLAEGSLAGLGIEMGKLDMSEMREQMKGERPEGGPGGGGMPGGGIPGGRPGGGRPGGGGPGGMRGDTGEEIEVWAKIRLAKRQ